MNVWSDQTSPPLKKTSLLSLGVVIILLAVALNTLRHQPKVSPDVVLLPNRAEGQIHRLLTPKEWGRVCAFHRPNPTTKTRLGHETTTASKAWGAFLKTHRRVHQPTQPSPKPPEISKNPKSAKKQRPKPIPNPTTPQPWPPLWMMALGTGSARWMSHRCV